MQSQEGPRHLKGFTAHHEGQETTTAPCKVFHTSSVSVTWMHAEKVCFHSGDFDDIGIIFAFGLRWNLKLYLKATNLHQIKTQAKPLSGKSTHHSKCQAHGTAESKQIWKSRVWRQMFLQLYPRPNTSFLVISTASFWKPLLVELDPGIVKLDSW